MKSKIYEKWRKVAERGEKWWKVDKSSGKCWKVLKSGEQKKLWKVIKSVENDDICYNDVQRTMI